MVLVGFAFGSRLLEMESLVRGVWSAGIGRLFPGVCATFGRLCRADSEAGCLYTCSCLSLSILRSTGLPLRSCGTLGL